MFLGAIGHSTSSGCESCGRWRRGEREHLATRAWASNGISSVGNPILKVLTLLPQPPQLLLTAQIRVIPARSE